MSIPAEQLQQGPVPPPAVAAIVGTGQTSQQAATTLQDAVQGGLIGQTESALQGNPAALLGGVGAVLLVALGVFVYLIVEAVHNANHTAQSYVGSIFTASGVWVIVAGVLVGGAFVAKSPLRNPPAILGSYTGK